MTSIRAPSSTFQVHVHVDAPVETVFGCVEDPRHFLNAMAGRGVMTREEYIPNERIADRSSTGPVRTFTFEPVAGRDTVRP